MACQVSPDATAFATRTPLAENAPKAKAAAQAPPSHDLETVLPNGITVYGKPHVVDQLRATVEPYDIWGHPQFADIPMEQWMRIPLIPGWEDKVPKPQIYK